MTQITEMTEMVPAMAYEVFVKNVSSSLHVPFRFCCEFERSQLIHSVNSAKCRRRSQGMSLSFI